LGPSGLKGSIGAARRWNVRIAGGGVKYGRYASLRSNKTKISYEDGTVYKIQDVVSLDEIIPGKGKSISSIEVGTVYGAMTCTIYFKDYSSDSVIIRSSGPEDKVTHFVDTIVLELTRDADITILARKVWPTAWAFLISLSIWLPLGWSAVHDLSTWYGLGMITFISTIFLAILLDLFRRHWLKPVAFLWGVDGRRAKQAKSIVTAVLVTLPLWLIGNFVSKLIFA
jgi:hypothetical protein